MTGDELAKPGPPARCGWSRNVLQCAAAPDRDLRSFKADVRQLNELGLTESLEVGYRLSPRGRALLDLSEAS